MSKFVEQAVGPTQTQDGPRYAWALEVKGRSFEIATGYDVASDSWPFHVYLLPPNGGKLKVLQDPASAESQQQALHKGLLVAKAYADQN